MQVDAQANLEVRLEIADLQVENATDSVIWTGQVTNAVFLVHAPNAVAIGPKMGRISVRVAGLVIARLYFKIRVSSDATERRRSVSSNTRRISRAFASYSHVDRQEVLGRLQGMRKVAPDLDVFLDIDSIRSGEKWKERTQEEIGRSDVLYLFWSTNAQASRYVDFEWRTALRDHGIDHVDPVPIMSPRLAPPPTELAELHFGDRYLEFRD